MIDKYTEARLENWARANRENFHQASKCPTQVFCENLRYLYGMPEEEEGQTHTTSHSITTIDLKDAEKLDMAYRSELLPNVYKSLLRMYYVNRVNPRSIERRLCLAHKTFSLCQEKAVRALMAIVSENEERKHNCSSSDKI